jgi:hypothetical protein
MANPSTVQMRRIVLSELCACFASKSHMTKQELFNSINKVEISQSLYKWLLDTGILISTRGKGASVSLATPMNVIVSNLDRYAYRESQQGYTTTSRRQATKVEGDVLLKRGKFVVDAKSFLGVLSIDVSQDTTVIYPEDAEEFEIYINQFKKEQA